MAIERRSPAPLVRLGILPLGAAGAGRPGALLFVGAFVAFQFIVVLYLQELRGWSALETGLALLIAGIDTILASDGDAVVRAAVRQRGGGSWPACCARLTPRSCDSARTGRTRCCSPA